MQNQVEVIIQPITLRFTLHNDEIYYLVGGSPEASLDQAELLMGIDPKKAGLMDSNLGFLPVSSTILIRGEKNILIDPNNHHIGFYGLLGKALQKRGLAFDDIDVVVVTHWHHDHSANVGMFAGGELVIGKDELGFAKEVYGEEDTEGKIKNYSVITEVGDVYDVCPGVKVLYTPGHTPGSICVIADEDGGKTAVMGDSILTRQEWFDDAYSHWYTQEQLDGLKRTKELVKTYNPKFIIPGHDKKFLNLL